MRCTSCTIATLHELVTAMERFCQPWAWQVRNARVQGDGGSQQFKGGAGFVDVADVKVPPHLVPVVHLFFRGHLRKGFRVLGKRISGIVGIVFAGLRAGEDLAVAGVHDEAHDPRRLRTLLAGCDLLLHDILDVLVQGKDRGIAVLRAVVGVCAVSQRISGAVLVLDPTAVEPRQIAVVTQFHARQAVVVVRRGADDVRRESAQRIVALGVFGDLQTHEICFSQLIRGVAVHVFGELQQLSFGVKDFHDGVEIHA